MKISFSLLLNYKNMIVGLVLIPIISAFIGWFTNWIAIKMLFHPRLPKKIMGFTFQGIFPKRQHVFAEKLGQLVSQELLSFKDIEAAITKPENIQRIMPEVEAHIDHFLKVKLSKAMPVISMFISEKTTTELKNIFTKELEELLPSLMKSYAGNLQQSLDLEKIVTEKVATFSGDKLEAILNQIMSKEFRFVEIIGAVLGFVIGLMQVIISWLGK
jgi:uncharacterized membrane protein YheB (UPF0754 family)